MGTGWISTNENMPEEGQCVLCIDEWGNYRVAWRGIGSWHETVTEYTITDNIKWWMPLPHRPEEVSDNVDMVE